MINISPEGAVLDRTGKNVIVPAVPGVFPGDDSTSLLKQGETIQEVNSSGKTTGTFGTVNSDSIVHFTKSHNMDTGKTKNTRVQSTNRSQLK